MLTTFPANVGSEWVTGVMAPIYSERCVLGHGQAPVTRNASLRRNSVPGTSLMICSFSIL
ncbi:MAG: hypothetical protein Ct9H300mP1_04030 [Planctomycetaceae bacterium]|nr:MAG: hypothetical protein Ct9H300mP1_04030 [Planctomycetaceae bacterium]